MQRARIAGVAGMVVAIVASADGSIERGRAWTTYEVDLLLPGLGLRMKQRRFLFSANVRTGLAYLHASGSVAGGTGETMMTLSGSSFVVQAELEACRRL